MGLVLNMDRWLWERIRRWLDLAWTWDRSLGLGGAWNGPNDKYVVLLYC
jgi:hypothetical protein